MVTIDGISSLNMVKDEVESTLKLAEGGLEAFIENKDNVDHLKNCVEYITQVKGIFRLIGLPGATLLTNELEFLGTHILNQESEDYEAELGAMGNALIVLTHYLEYVHVKQSSLPVLLIPAINEIRQISRRELEPESRFFSVDLNVVRSFDKEANPVDPEELPKLCRRLRHMYQVGLIGVIRGDNEQTNLKLMLRAVERIDRMCGDVAMGRLWWVSIALLEAMVGNNLELSNRRKSVLGRIDRQIKQLVFQGAHIIEKEPDAQLLKEIIYLVSLAPTSEMNSIQEVQSAYSVDHIGITDEMLRAERDLMNGPGGSVIQTVAKALQEELAQIKDMLDLGARGAQTRGDEGFSSVTETLSKIAHTLVMLGLVDPSNVLKDLSERIKNWEQEEIDPHGDDFHSVADALLYVENSIAELRKSKTSSAVDDMPIENDSISISQLEEARHVVVGEARAGLSLAKRAISSYIDSHWDGMHLNNVPTTLKTVWGGLKFLQLERAASVLDRCNQFIETKLISMNEDSPNEQLMETLADALTSIDYYLESMEGNKPIGDGVLDVAEESVDELGFPVVMA